MTQIESEIREFCDKLPLSSIHIEIAIEEGKRAGCAEMGKLCAARISARVQTLREKFPHARLTRN